MDNNNLPVATDKECMEIRNELIKQGIIKQGKLKTEREKLISAGCISSSPCPVLKHKFHPSDRKDEGEYQVVSIKNDKDYLIKRANYFRMMQEILQARSSLKLILGPKNEQDPDWFF